MNLEPQWYVIGGKVQKVNDPIALARLNPDRALPAPHTLSEPDLTSIWLYNGNREYCCLINTVTQERTYQILLWDTEFNEGESPVIFEYKSMAKEPTMYVFLKWYDEVQSIWRDKELNEMSQSYLFTDSIKAAINQYAAQ